MENKKKLFEYGTPLGKKAYADLMGVAPSYITQKLVSLETAVILGKEYILHTKKNEKLFPDNKKSHKRGGNRVKN